MKSQKMNKTIAHDGSVNVYVFNCFADHSAIISDTHLRSPAGCQGNS